MELLNKMDKTIVVNKNLDEYDYYGGRGSILGNPYVIGKDGTREEVIKRYEEEWFKFLLRDKYFIKFLKMLKGKKIACFCKQPDKDVHCHLDVVADWINNH